MKLMLLLQLLFVATKALALAPGPEWQVRTLMIAAIDTPSGRANGELQGPIAEAMRLRLQGIGPITIQVSTLKRYRQPGCSRLNLRFSQEGVQLQSQPTPQTQTLDVGIDYCRDGSAPASRR